LWKYFAFESFIIRIKHEPVLKVMDMVDRVGSAIVWFLPSKISITQWSWGIQNPKSEGRLARYISFGGIPGCGQPSCSIVYDLLYSILGDGVDVRLGLEIFVKW